MSSWSDLETMVAVCGPQAGSAGGKREPGEFLVARDPRQGPQRPLLVPDIRTQLCGPVPPPPAALPALLPRAASLTLNPAQTQDKSRSATRPGLAAGTEKPAA